MNSLLATLSKRFFIKRFAFILILFTGYGLMGQEDADYETLKNEYLKGGMSVEERYELLNTISKATPNVMEKLSWADTLMSFAIREGIPKYRIQAHLDKAYAYHDMGNYDLDIKETLHALAIADSTGYKQGKVYNHLAVVYKKVNDTAQAIKYYHRSIALNLSTDPIDYKQLTAIYYNYSDFLLKKEILDSAFIYLEKARVASTNDSPEFAASIKPYLQGNLGVYYLKTKAYAKAKPLIEKSAEALRSENPEGTLEYYNYLTEMAREVGDLEEALIYANSAIEFSKETNTFSHLPDTYFNLYEIEKERGNPTEALEYYITHQKYKDSMIILPLKQMYRRAKDYAVASIQREADYFEQEAELQELRAYRSNILSYVSIGAVILLSLLIFGLFNRFKYIRKTSKIIEAEKERSDQLLRNILPDETATELKNHGKVKAKQFDSVSVLFADFCGFTKYTANMEPQALVERVDLYFSKFDKIMEAYGLEKIKTIGDAYMCAGGLPFPGRDHAERLVRAAFDMLEEVKKVKSEDPDDPTRFDIRIGINTGPVVAGVVGTKKFVYDIWGDTVNIASRMESNSEAGQVNVSENTYQLIKNSFECDYRGMVDVKHKGMMKMYFVNPNHKAI